MAISNRGPGKGNTNNPNGRPKGIPNKITTEIREGFELLVRNNMPDLQVWIDRIKHQDPDKAFDMLMKLSSFVVPKKMETDVHIDSPIEIILPGVSKDDIENKDE